MKLNNPTPWPSGKRRLSGFVNIFLGHSYFETGTVRAAMSNSMSMSLRRNPYMIQPTDKQRKGNDA